MQVLVKKQLFNLIFF